jgi:predicted nucleotidyltransferase
LYGSYARGDYNNESDIDIMVLVDRDKYELMKYRRSVISFLRPIEFEHEILVSVHLQDIDTFNNWRDDLPFYINVIKEGVVINA